MNSKKTTKHALMSSVVALLLCCAMLIGTTFAWFTDTASTAVNKIQAGTLDVALEMYDGANWVSAEGKILQFKVNGAIPASGTQILWEPGCTYELPALRVVNKGNLALKYKVIITGINGDATLNDVIDWTIGTVALGTEQHLAVGANNEFTIKGHMQETAGNEYQGLSIDGIGITVVATQDTVESDSVNNQYDKDALYPVLAPVLNYTDSIGFANTPDTEKKIENDKAVSKIPASTAIYENASDTTPIVLESDGELHRVLKTTDSSADSVTYDIGYYYVSGSAVTEVHKFGNVVENIIQLSTGLKEVKVTHNGTAMTEATTKADGTYSYDAATGKLYIYSSTYSSYTISYKSEHEVAVDGQGMSVAAFRDSVNAGNSYAGKTVVLLRNLDLSGSEWTPIGQKNGNKFSGVFDGKNFKVEGMKISNTNEIQNRNTFDGYAAFFGAINGGTVKNLSVYGSVNSKNAAGVVARVDGNSSVINCHNYATVTAPSNGKAGGVICLTNKAAISVQNCTNSGTVSGGNSGTAGIVGYANEVVKISDCSNFGNIGDESCRYSGGIVGYATGDNATGSITKCSNSGIIAAKEQCGGIVGIITGSQNVTNCTNTQSVKGTDAAFSGGIVGSFAGGTIKDCTNTASVHGKFAGGVVGSAQKGVIENCSGGTAAITSPAFTLDFTGQSFILSVGENKAAGRILGTNQGSGPNDYTVLKLANNEDDHAIGTVGMCGNLTTWANLKISSGTFYGEPLAGNTTYITLEAGATWGNKAVGTYYCGGLTGSRIDTWQIKSN
jgi:predicted ribosomally synthesized peptide with SipW-like signal peptide